MYDFLDVQGKCESLSEALLRTGEFDTARFTLIEAKYGVTTRYNYLKICISTELHNSTVSDLSGNLAL